MRIRNLPILAMATAATLSVLPLTQAHFAKTAALVRTCVRVDMLLKTPARKAAKLSNMHIGERQISLAMPR